MVIQNKEIVEDFPEDLLRSIASNPSQPILGPWTVTLRPYILKPFMGIYIYIFFSFYRYKN